MMKSKKQNLEQLSQMLTGQIIENAKLIDLKGGGDPPPQGANLVRKKKK